VRIKEKKEEKKRRRKNDRDKGEDIEKENQATHKNKGKPHLLL
jgi:hypothetical protein